MCLHIELALLDVLLQMSVSLILHSSQLQHRLSNCIECTFQCRSIQCYMRCLHYYMSHWSRRSLRTWWSLSIGGSRGSSIAIRGSSTIRGSSIIRGPPPLGGPSQGYPPLLGGLLSLSGYLPLSGGLPC